MARQLGEAIVHHKLELVYGGAAIGLMGEVADQVLLDGGVVYGVIPKRLQDKELAHGGIQHLEVVDSMHERKARMASLSDGFIALPGGFGTFEELFEVLTWAQLGIHKKPIGLLNVDGYYDHLLQFLDHAAEQRLLQQRHRDLLMVETDPHALLRRFRVYEPKDVERWMSLDET
jgi:uncharacterized protein (TIGR00730 family)